MATKFPFYEQLDSKDCGVACLRMIASYHGCDYASDELGEITYLNRDGASLLNLSQAAEKIGLKSVAAPVPFDRLMTDIPLPAIAYWENYHFLVVYKVNNKYVWIGDPARKKVEKITHQEFKDSWVKPRFEEQQAGILLLLEPTADFHNKRGDQIRRNGLFYLFDYYKIYSRLLVQLIIGVVVTGLILAIFPFLIQSIIDTGVEQEDYGFILVVFIIYVVLKFGQRVIEFIRDKIIRHISDKVSFRLLSDYMMKLLQRPVKYFDRHVTGDILQRISENKKVEDLLSSTALNALFSIASFLAYGVVLALYNRIIFGVFLIGMILYFGWTFYCLGKWRRLDARRFQYAIKNQTTLVEFITGIQELKQHNLTTAKRWEWEGIQKKINDLNQDYFKIEQQQQFGDALINDITNIGIIALAAYALIDPAQRMTLGMIVGIQYILGQLNSPKEQISQALRLAQNAKISIERMNEIHQLPADAPDRKKMDFLPADGYLAFDKVSFRYGSPNNPLTLKQINLLIPEGKTVAIVGESGSGKSTLLKLLMGFYAPVDGVIRLGGVNIDDIHEELWRKQFAAVLQNGKIFTDTIANNITFGEGIINKEHLLKVARLANIHQFIDKQPQGYSTIINEENVSEGQKQRLLIARAMYKNPKYLFLDEPTNPLDTYNEMIIMENLEEYFQDTTIIIVSQRLSTITNAHLIVVMAEGEIIEKGSHQELMNMRGAYYQMQRNESELSIYR